MNKNAVFDLQNPEMSSRPLGLQQMVPSSAQLHFQKLDKQVRRAVPVMFMGMDLFKCAIHGLNRSKMKDILTTAHENLDVIVDTDNLKWMNLEQATELWQEIVTDMGCNPICKDYISTVSGNTGRISSKIMANGKAVKVNIVSLDDGTPILFDSDWCEKFKQSTRMPKSQDISWQEIEIKKQEPVIDNNRDVVPGSKDIHSDKNQIYEPGELLQEKLEGEERRNILREELQNRDVYERRIQLNLKNQNEIADDVEAAKLDHKRIKSLQMEFQTQKDALVIQNQQIHDLKIRLERNALEKVDIKNQLTELRESVQALNQAQQIEKENTEASLTDWHMALTDSEDEQKQSTSTQRRKAIATVAKNEVTATLQQIPCWICEKQGHLTKDCPGNSSPKETKTLKGNKSNAKCYSCGGTGHFKQECANTKCYACGGTGHFARECANTKQNSTRKHSKWSKKN